MAMRSSGEPENIAGEEKKYKGVRRRKWGKWVSEIRVPGSTQRLWLGSYSTPEAAAMAHDTAVVLLRPSSSSFNTLNFPNEAPSFSLEPGNVSPDTVQRLASNRGMAMDARLTVKLPEKEEDRHAENLVMLHESEFGGGDISVDDYICN